MYLICKEPLVLSLLSSATSGDRVSRPRWASPRPQDRCSRTAPLPFAKVTSTQGKINIISMTVPKLVLYMFFLFNVAGNPVFFFPKVLLFP